MRWIAAAAHAGSGSLLLWAIAAALLLVPSAFVIAKLSRLFPEEGGLYVWTREAFGEWHGFACGWFYFINNLFWIPGLLISSIGMLLYSFSPKWAPLAENAAFVLPCALVLLAAVTASNYVGLRIAKWVDNFGGIGAYVIWVILILAAIAVLMIRGSATKFTFLPGFDKENLNFWSQMAFGLTGLELSPILSGEIRSPKRTIFRATWISAVLIVLFYGAGTAALLVFLRPDQISPVVGIAQASGQAASLPGLSWVPFAISISILLSLGGQISTYLGANARLPFVLGMGNMLPAAFARLHPRYKTPYVSILFLGIGSGCLLVLSQIGETFRAAYQLTVDMSVITLFIPFLYIFCAAWKFGQRLPAICGLFVSLIAIVFSFIPTSDVTSWRAFDGKLIAGCAILFALARFLYVRHRHS